MRKIFLTILFLLIPFGITYAYTLEDVQEHNTSGDCWMIFEEKIYDFSEYIPSHDKYLNIREWCGLDMTEDFKSKGDLGRDHRESTYALLEMYEIGELEATEGNEVDLVDAEIILTEESNEDQEVVKGRKYNLIIPLIISVILYWGTYFLVKRNKLFGLTLVKFNAFWNSILFLTLLVPALGFGTFMVIRTQKPELWNIDFDFLYWHVELSMVMGILGMNHFIQRLGIYFKQLKK